ncbi:VapE domain-containing protein [Prevotella sp.]|uniref:VapE domain-containing protein n=1 Tax=Prevotella sp. TaxID=59823 RepID=UPI002649589A|nr:VapE domain-containing protein [Prevotella sp.]MDN5554171.1 DUF3874 domain-containing protein [Prevotella sp.]
MKVSVVRTDKQNKTYLQTITIEKLIERICNDKSNGTIADLRHFIPIMSEGMTFHNMHLLPRVYPSVVMQKDADGDISAVEYNGIILLTICNLKRQESIDAVKIAAAQLPTTLAAFAGASGRSVKLLVKTSLANGCMPENEQEATKLYRATYPCAVKIYEAAVGEHVKIVNPSIKNGFRLTADDSPYLNLNATALLIDPDNFKPNLGFKEAKDAISGIVNVEKQDHIDIELYDEMEFMYHRAVDIVAANQIDDNEQRFAHEAFSSRVAWQLCKMGMPEEEAVLHMRAHCNTREAVNHCRTVISSVYAEFSLSRDKKIDDNDYPTSIRNEQMQIIKFLERRYVFRYNEVMKYTEYRPNNTWVLDYKPVDQRVQNRMAIEARLEGMNAWDKDITRYVESDYVKNYNPIEDFLWKCRGKWDGHDRIRELARTVPTNNANWENWFYTWFLAVVNQWLGIGNSRYGNSVAPLLISGQGYNKSTFCRRLLPQELQWGYNDNLVLAEKKQVLQAMSEFLIINLDEFNQISPQVQQGFLKNLIQLPNVKIKRPYGKHVEQHARRASFIGTSNMRDVLTDPSGCRRFIGVEITSPIDVSKEINYVQLYAQALSALEHKEPCYFDEEQTALIMKSNQQFQAKSAVEQYFYEYFSIGTKNDSDASFMTTAAILSYLKKQLGSDIKLNNLRSLGRVLTNMDGLERKRTNTGTAYLVKIRQKQV